MKGSELPLSIVWGQESRQPTVNQEQSESTPQTQPVCYPDLRFLASRTVKKKKSLLFKTPSLWYSLIATQIEWGNHYLLIVSAHLIYALLLDSY